MSDLRNDGSLSSKRWATVHSMLVLLVAAPLLAVANAEFVQAQQGTTAEYNQLSSCEQYIPIAREIDKRIVDHIGADRVQFNCADFTAAYIDGFKKKFLLVRLSNSQFCYEKYCYTFVYDERSKTIVFSTDAEENVGYFHNAEFFVYSLRKIWLHKFDNPVDGFVLTTKTGLLAISVINEILIVETPQPTKRGE